MASTIKVTTSRAKSCVTQEGAGKRITSKDGLRWAISRNAKRSLPDRCWDVVEAWTLRERRDGRAVIVASGMSEQFARAFIAGGAA